MSWIFATLGQLFGVIWTWKWTYLVPIATLLLPATIYALRLPDTYDVTAVVQINEKSLVATRADQVGVRGGTAYDLISTTRERLLSFDNAKVLVPILAPDADPDNGAIRDKLRARMEWSRLSDGNFGIGMTDEDGHRAALAVNALVEQFLQSEMRIPREQAAQTHAASLKQLQAAEKGESEAREAIDVFYSDKAHLGAMKADVERLNAELTALRTRHREHQGAMSKLQQEKDVLEGLIARGPTSLEDASSRKQSGEERRLSDELTSQQQALTEAMTTLSGMRASGKTENHPKVRAASRQVATLKGVVGEVRKAYDAAQSAADAKWRKSLKGDRDQWFRSQREKLSIKNAELIRIEPLIAQLNTREKELYETLRAAPALSQRARPLLSAHELAHESLKDAQKAEVDSRSRVEFLTHAAPSLVTPYQVIELASAPAKPTGPSRMKYIIMAFAAGGLLGYGLMLLRRRHDSGNVMNASDIAGLLPGALVVEVPQLEQGPVIPAASVARDVVFGAWVAGCFGIAAFAILARKGIVDAPLWLAKILEGGA